MTRFAMRWMLVAGFMMVACVVPALAQQRGGARGGASGGQGGVRYGAGNGPDPQQIQQVLQNIGTQLQAGERVYQESNEKAEEVRREFQRVDTEHKQNLKALAQAKKLAEEEANNSPELKAAREQADGLRKELAEVRKQVVEQLKSENEDYQKAVKDHEAAVAEQKANSGANVSQDTRRSLAKKVAESERVMKIQEDATLTDHTEAKAIKEKIKQAEAEVSAAAKAKKDAIENDPGLSSAKVAFQRTRDELKGAKQNLDQAEGELGRIRSGMLALVNQRNSLMAQQQMMQRMQQGQQGGGGGGGGQPRRR